MKTRLTLRPGRRFSFNQSADRLLKRLPLLEGRVVHIRFLPALTVGSGKLYSNRAVGQPVYAGTYVRRREIVLDHELRQQSTELARIFTHELFHFAWVRLGNNARRSYDDMLRGEWRQHARGELGWSAESRKSAFSHLPRPTSRHMKWRDYVCESFCDTAAWLYSGVRRHKEFTLGSRHRKRRADWFRETYPDGGIPI